LARVEVIEPDIGYIRLADISENTVTALDAELKKFSDARVVGYVLDLRFADGTNYPVAADVAGRFLASKQEVFTLKRSDGPSREFRAADASQAVPAGLSDAPLMVLINARTRGSAEALAGALHALDRAILVGGKTDGSAISWDDIKLEDGRVLRVATAKIELPKGGQIFPGGLIPDIPVKIDPKVEQDAVLNSSTNLTLTASLRPREAAKALSEAVLVKAFRGEPVVRVPAPLVAGDATTNKSTTTPQPGAPEPVAANGAKPAGEEGAISEVHDVVLQRAVDILKGIHVLMSSRGE
jgi:C-terminal processing protease CtpA/Prc